MPLSQTSTYTDEELLPLVIQGNEQAFSELYLRYYQLLRPFVWKLTRADYITDEIIQRTFIRVWLYRDKLSEIRNFRAWVFKVASRENLNYLRKELQHHRPYSLKTTDTQTPANLLQATEVKTLIRKAIEHLPEQRRRIFQLSRDKGLTVTEIAALLSISERTVVNSISIALRKIRDQLQAAGYHLPLLLLFFKNYF